MSESCDVLKLSLELHEITCHDQRCGVSPEPVREFLTQVMEYLDDRADVTDGADGQPRPNDAMGLHTEAARLLRRLPTPPQKTRCREWAQTDMSEEA